MPKDISIKALRENLAEFADRVEQGESFRVIRRSKPSFYVVRIDDDEALGDWETVVDFTAKGKTAGAPLKDVIKALRKMR